MSGYIWTIVAYVVYWAFFPKVSKNKGKVQEDSNVLE